jgi:Baseplate J-like protein
MSLVTLASQLVQETKAQIYARGLAIAASYGLNTTSWVAGDPTRSLFHFVSTILESLEINVAGFMRSGFLDYAEGDWLTIQAEQVYDVERVAGTYATTTVTLTNAGGATYIFEAGDITAQSSTTGKTYRNTEGGTLDVVGAPEDGDVLTLDFTADEIGSDSSAGANEIDTLVTTFLGVTITASDAAIGLDEESDDSLRDRCRAKLGTLSATGPRDAYDFVVRDSELTGVDDITRSRTLGDSTTGDVTVYVAGTTGAVAGASVTAAQSAVEQWAAPLCVTPVVTNAAAVTIPVTYEVWLYDSVGEETAAIAEQIESDLGDMFAVRPIGGDIIAPASTGSLYQSLIASTIKASYPSHTFRVVVTAPAGDTSLAINEVAVLGTVIGTINLESDP